MQLCAFHESLRTEEQRLRALYLFDTRDNVRFMTRQWNREKSRKRRGTPRMLHADEYSMRGAKRVQCCCTFLELHRVIINTFHNIEIGSGKNTISTHTFTVVRVLSHVPEKWPFANACHVVAIHSTTYGTVCTRVGKFSTNLSRVSNQIYTLREVIFRYLGNLLLRNRSFDKLLNLYVA